MNPKLFAQLRPRQPLAALVEALGSDWRPPPPEDQGCLWGPNHCCLARIDVQHRLGLLGFYRAFPSAFQFEGLRLGMSMAAALAHRPGLRHVLLPAEQQLALVEYRDQTTAGDHLRVRFFRRELVGLELECPGLSYPGAELATAATGQPEA